MNQTNANYQQVEDEIVDTLTGEILDAADNAKIVVDDLPKVCRALRAIRRRKQIIDDYLTTEVNRLTEICNLKTQPLTAQEQRLSAIAESLLVTSGERRLAYPGLGVVRFVKGRESVSTEKWDTMTPEQKIQFQNVNKTAVRVVTELKPDKVEIMRQIKAGMTSTVPLETAFEINTPPDRFEFKTEGD